MTVLEEKDAKVIAAMNESAEKFGSKPCAHGTASGVLCKECLEELFAVIDAHEVPGFCKHAIPLTRECPLCKETR